MCLLLLKSANSLKFLDLNSSASVIVAGDYDWRLFWTFGALAGASVRGKVACLLTAFVWFRDADQPSSLAVGGSLVLLMTARMVQAAG